MISAFFQGWRTSLRSWRIVLIVYSFQLLLAMIIGMLVYDKLDKSIGNSLGLKKLLSDYDYTVIQDIINVHGDFLSPLQAGLPWLILCWLIFSAFISGGLLFSVIKRMPTREIFWAGGAKYFFPFLKTGLFFSIVFILLSAAIWIPVTGDWQAMIQKLPSEREYAFILFGVLSIYLLLILFIFSWATISKLIFIKEEKTVWQAIKNGLKQTLRISFKTILLLIAFSALLLTVTFSYWQLENTSGMTAPFLILVFFLVQQVLILFRIFWRIAIYRSLDFLHNQHFLVNEN